MTQSESDLLQELTARVSTGGYTALSNSERGELYRLRALPQGVESPSGLNVKELASEEESEDALG